MSTQTVTAVRRRRRPAAVAYSVFRVAAIVAILLFFLVPMVWMVLASLKTNLQITDPSTLFNFDLTWTNYETVFGQENFLPFIWNSFYIGFLATAISLVIGVPAAWAMARFRMTRSASGVLVARIIPGVSLLIPWYYVFAQLGLVGGYTGLVLSHMFVSLPLIVWILLSFFESLPEELEEAGQIDGLTPIGAFRHITLRLATPGIATAAILSFIFSWNNFMFALILAGENTRTLPVAIFNFVSYASIDWGGLMAASVVITVPMMVISLFFQRYIVAGLSAGATKG
ncbi:carbohydrate ABC transporter permease [Tessaracoccus terricola]